MNYLKDSYGNKLFVVSTYLTYRKHANTGRRHNSEMVFSAFNLSHKNDIEIEFYLKE